MTEHRPRMELADYIRELTEPHTHAEAFEYATRDLDGHLIPRPAGAGRHAIRVPSLLAQLWANDTPSAAAEEGPRPGFQSKPAARLDALDTAVRIDLDAHRWIVQLGESARSLDTADTIRQLHGLSASADHETRRAIEHDVRRWWIRARIVTGWDSAAWKPDNTCPQCGERGTLRVRLDDHIATCRNDACGVVWDESTIGLLADHIRLESELQRRARPGSGPCWCPVPEPAVPDLRFVCPRCGSARCWHAVQARLLASVRDERMGA